MVFTRSYGATNVLMLRGSTSMFMRSSMLRLHAHTSQQFHGRGDIVQMRYIGERHGRVGQQGRRQNRQRGILRAGNADLAGQRRAAA